MCGFGGKIVCFVTAKPFALNYYLNMQHSGEKPKRNNKGPKIESSFVITEMNSKHSQVLIPPHTLYIPFGGHVEHSRDKTRPDFATSLDQSKISGFARPHSSKLFADSKISTLESGFKKFRIRM